MDGLNNALRQFVRKRNLKIAKQAYRHIVVPAYRWADIPVYDITASWKHKYTWFRIPKNGTHSIMQLLLSMSTPDINSSYVPYFPARHASQIRFCVIRNPWDRLVSVYCNKVGMKLMYPECWDRDFAYFIDFITRQDLRRCDGHIRLQTAMFPAGDVNDVARMESFTDDISRIMTAIFNTHVEVPRIGAIEHGDYRVFYTAALRSQVGRLYEADVEFGRYTF